MKTLISAVLLVLPWLAQAEMLVPPVLTQNMVCVDGAKLHGTLERYGEQPSLAGIAARLVDTPDQVFPTQVTVFINYTTKTWTFVERIGPDLWCVLAVGQHIAPVTPDSPAVN